MRLQAKEKQARYRARLKEKGMEYEEHLARDRKRKAESRRRFVQTASVMDLAAYHLKESRRMKKLRAKQKNPGDPLVVVAPYKSKQALGKAIRKVAKNLPSSPRKKRCIAEMIAKEAGVELKVSSSTLPAQQSGARLSDNAQESIREFYGSNDISWQAPGRKDVIIVRETDVDGKSSKTSMQARYMLMSLKEAHQMFIMQNPNIQIGLSKFCELRPKHIKLFDSIPHNVCVCTYHENVRLLLIALKQFTQLSPDTTEFVRQVTCDPQSKACMTRECADCLGKIDQYLPQLAPNTPQETVTYHQWQTTDRAQKVAMKASIHDIFGQIKAKLQEFLVHVYVKRQQADYRENQGMQWDRHRASGV
jgi:hypothetical protein